MRAPRSPMDMATGSRSPETWPAAEFFTMDEMQRARPLRDVYPELAVAMEALHRTASRSTRPTPPLRPARPHRRAYSKA